MGGGGNTSTPDVSHGRDSLKKDPIEYLYTPPERI